MHPSPRQVLCLTIVCIGLAVTVHGPVRAELPQPTFHWSFDKGMQVETCAPGASPAVNGQVQFVPGRTGDALLVPENTTVALPVKGHINAKQGTVALWVKRVPNEGRPKYARLFDISNSEGERTSLRLVYPSHTILYGEMSVGDDRFIPWPMGDASVRDEQWQHLAITWGPRGGTFYVNGVTLTSTSSMPELANLPESFYVGSEQSGVFGACAPIDDLYIFDRPLRSHELFELAGRQSPTDLAAANTLANSSFELGLPPWHMYLWGADETETTVVDDVAHGGSHSLLVDRREEHDWWSTVWLVGPWLHLQRHETVTFSAWVRADRPGAQVGLDIQAGDEGRAVQGVPADARLLSYHQVGENWQRVVLTGELPISYKDGYRPRLHLLTKPCKLWVDDVQLALGEPRDYAPASEVEFGLAPAADTTTCYLGDEARAALRVFNSGGGTLDAEAQISAALPDGTVCAERRIAINAAPGSTVDVGLDPILVDRPGHYVITARIGDESRTITFAGMRSHAAGDVPRASPFGTHGGGDEKALRTGLNQFRDVGNLTWRWIERQEGDWRYDAREASYSARSALGFANCATLADAPPWASQSNGDLVPDKIDQWQRYVRSIVTDFAPWVDIWEVWNEPDLKPTFVNQPERYFEILKTARAIQREADPDSQLAGLCAAGVNQRVYDWVEGILKLGALAQMDLLAWHPYYDTDDDADFRAKLRQMNELMDKYGGRKPMIFTEFGMSGVSDWSLHIPWAADGWRRFDEREQAELLVRQCVISLAEGAVKLYWYQWDEERHQTGPDTFGLNRADTWSTPKLALISYSNMIDQLGAASLPPEGLAMAGETQWGYEFKTANGRTQVVWDPAAESEYAVPEGARLIDLWGTELPAASRVRLGPSPLYVLMPQ